MFSAHLKVGLTLKPSKLQFGSKRVKYLGHVISAEGITIGNDRIIAISELPDPKNIKELPGTFVIGYSQFCTWYVGLFRTFQKLLCPC